LIIYIKFHLVIITNGYRSHPRRTHRQPRLQNHQIIQQLPQVTHPRNTTTTQLYSFLTRRTDSKFNQVVHKRLNQSRLNRYPISISRIAKHLSHDKATIPAGKTVYNSRIVAIVGTVTNDIRFLNVPEGLRICALKFTAAAKNRIHQAKGETLTFDQLAQLAPTGKNVLLLRGTRDREAKRFFGLCPGQKNSHTAPRVRSEGRKFERARGRR
jgi:large subunit ribosomal protein L18e